MKRYSIMLSALLSLFFLIGCGSRVGKSNQAFEKGTINEDMISTDVHAELGDSFSSIYNQVSDRVIVNYYSCIAWKNTDGYELICTTGDRVEALARFSTSLELIKQENINLISDFDTDEWIGKEEKLFVLQYGSYHFDAGSGFYIPAYISNTGKIYCFSVENGVIRSISVQSFLSTD